MYKAKVKYLYKELLYMGKDYPSGYNYFRTRLKRAFAGKRNLKGKEIEDALNLGEYVKKELEALYKLRVYRAVKRNYYND